MSAMVRLALRAVLLTATLTFLSLSIPSRAQGQDVKQYLRDQYQGKILVLRGFQANDVVRYDSSGSPTNANSGDWTTDGFVQVNDIRLSDNRLIIKARRLLVFSFDKNFQFRPAEQATPGKKQKKPVRVEIEADLGTDNPSPEQADAAISKIFLGTQDDLGDLVPDYWKPCVTGGLSGKDADCSFSPDILAVAGVHPEKDRPTSETTGAANAVGGAASNAYRAGGGVSPPRATFTPEPGFSEEARMAKFQGVIVLGLVVNAEGLPTRIRVVRPLGCGLDAKAVEAVQQWRFKPAEKDGQPIPYEITVEVDFHLY